MVLVDTSVWVDFLRGVDSPHRLVLRGLISAEEEVCLADIILAEVLQGIRSDRDFRAVKRNLMEFPIYSLKGVESYVSAAMLYRRCRKCGITLRGIIDCLIAQIAIEHGLVILHKDRDFERIAKVEKNLRVLPLPAPPFR
ncbi:MAG: PIN domain nuclease [Actinobacteria bacterium]|nr:PIN domain nuclease [Actinomycetota bacterium]